MKYRNLSAIPAWLPFALALVVVIRGSGAWSLDRRLTG